jgi:hypothetical protein
MGTGADGKSKGWGGEFLIAWGSGFMRMAKSIYGPSCWEEFRLHRACIGPNLFLSGHAVPKKRPRHGPIHWAWPAWAR